MKGLLLFVTFGVFANLNAQSLESFSLKGNVKSLQEELKICSNRYGKPQTKDCSTFTSEKQFTKEGNLLDYRDSLGSANITREKVEIPTGWLETVYKVEDGLKIKLGEHYYNKENLITQSLSFDEKGIVNRVKEFFYDEKGKKIKWEEVSEFNGVKEKTISFFDEYGSFSSFEIYHDDKLSDQGKFNVTYKFDENENWVESIVITEFSTDIHTRKITYY